MMIEAFRYAGFLNCAACNDGPSLCDGGAGTRGYVKLLLLPLARIV